MMKDHPFAASRFEQARNNLSRLSTVLTEGDWNEFLSLMEEEALALHAMMMSGRPGYVLMKAGTLEIIRKIRGFRQSSRLRLGFTLDAGANVHLIHAAGDAPEIEAFIRSELEAHCEKALVIRDRMGTGPKPL
jgi:diphosphomevalonate decarboxylase